LKHELSIAYLARHGETAWTLSCQHTGLTDLPLTEHGEHAARRLGERLERVTFAKVFTGPSQRTGELSGVRPVADPDLVEWNYGKYEVRRGDEIRAERPDWNLFCDSCLGGETPQQVSARADRITTTRVRAIPGNILLYTSGHFMRVLASR
jgi:broad specificity phosphatase PhoE